MKKVNIIFAILSFAYLMNGCNDVEPGYLITEYASYKPDSMVVKAVLDLTPPTHETVPNPRYELGIADGLSPELLAEFGIFPTYVKETVGEDYWQEKRGQPWVSTPIAGIEGTPQILVSIKDVVSVDGDAEKMKNGLSVRGDGTFEVIPRHGAPAGRYTVSLTFKNEGYSKDIDHCFVIIVK